MLLLLLYCNVNKTTAVCVNLIIFGADFLYVHCFCRKCLCFTYKAFITISGDRLFVERTIKRAPPPGTQTASAENLRA